MVFLALITWLHHYITTIRVFNVKRPSLDASRLQLEELLEDLVDASQLHHAQHPHEA